jgi:uncharacterized membrane-anchored protein
VGGPLPRKIRVKETGEVYKGTRQVAKAINGDFSTVADCLRGERHTHQGYSFEYAEDDEDD